MMLTNIFVDLGTDETILKYNLSQNYSKIYKKEWKKKKKTLILRYIPEPKNEKER